MEFKSRGGYNIQVSNGSVTLKKFLASDQTSFPLSEISEVKTNRSIYDIPLLEKTVTVYLRSGKKYAFKRLKKSDAAVLYGELTKQH